MKEYREQVKEEFLELEPLNRDQFLKLKETLTRIGAPSKPLSEYGKPVLWQTAHVFQSEGRHYLVHFKQMFLLDGRVKSTTYTEADKERLNSIAYLVQRWGLAKFKNPIQSSPTRVKVVPFEEKSEWELRQKYSIGERAVYL